MRRYEIMYIIRPDLEDSVRNALIEELNKILTDHNSTDLKVDEWGLKNFAYEINDFKKGYYVVLDVVASVETINELSRVMRIKENVIRHIVVNREES